MTGACDENALLLQAQPYLRRLCRKRWIRLEPEDRVAEASLVFILCLRAWPLDTGHFLRDFERVLTSHMDQKTRVLPPRFYGAALSLDEVRQGRGGSRWNGYHILPGRDPDESGFFVRSFLQALAEEDRDILTALLHEEITREAMAYQLGLSPSQLDAYLAPFWEFYESGRW